MKKRYHWRIYAACILLVISPCRIGYGVDDSWRRQLASRNVIHLALDTANKPVTSVAEIPSYVLAALSKISGESPFRIAERGQPFNATDVKVSDYNRRLIFAARSDKYFIICYESTGSEPSAIIFAIYPDAKVAEPILVGKVQGQCNTLEQLRRAYDSGQIIEYRPTFLDF
jgi:hypothetical protein